MKLRSNTTYSLDDANGNLRWAVLPAEVRLMILKELLEELKRGNERHELSYWASVSGEWQGFFEPQNFLDLKIQFPGVDIDDLNSIVYGYRRNLVKKISLHVQTEEYDSANQFDKPETKATIKANNKIITQALKKLFCALSTWVHSSPTGGIKLELSASSPSDADHPWKHRHGLLTQHDRSRTHSLNSKQRLLGNLLDRSSRSLSLDQVSIVKRFSVNQLCYRSLSSALLAEVLRSLCRLRTISYEPWYAVDQTGQTPRNEAMVTLLDFASQSATVKSVHLWEAQSSLHGNSRFYRPANDNLVSSAVNASYNLRGFTLCHAVDAKDFFQHASKDVSGNPTEAMNDVRVWPVLSYLALTTRIGDLASSPSNLVNLLLEASEAALRMPLLRLMEIWAPGAGEVFIFRYDARKDVALLTVAATWQIALNEKVVRSWEMVASRCARRELTYETRLVEPKTTASNSLYAYCFSLRLGKLLREWQWA
ncbi:uncharacterized protein CTRU02_213421 [Colletotrichum truncatum]|uniref:Uncharacterized protein n=1 Tax=Colletotrichum truncatum TaxID=5467 RepID=A0ACC3YKN3_COLTU|nr:uncharacterized protein CTRU02_13418 [Colletotrichum truncatum]KAF6783428.1 hypothetical protein CTRU02_13418 [Colletotrichum truncatum]